MIRGTVASLMKLIAAIEAAGAELLNEGDTSPIGGRGVRLREANVRSKQRVPARAQPHSRRSAAVIISRGGRST